MAPRPGETREEYRVRQRYEDSGEAKRAAREQLRKDLDAQALLIAAKKRRLERAELLAQGIDPDDPNGDRNMDTRVKMAYAYPRVSSVHQAGHQILAGGCNSNTAQADAIEDYWRRYLQPQGVAWGGIHQDSAVSAYCNDFQDRPEGAKLMRMMKRGDFLLVSKMDRLCRRSRDWHNLLYDLYEVRGITPVLVSQGGDTISLNTGEGKMYMGMLALFAEYESGAISQRTRGAKQFLRSNGIATTKGAPLGAKIAYRFLNNAWKKGRKPDRVLVWDKDVRLMMFHLATLVDSSNRVGNWWNPIRKAMIDRYGREKLLAVKILLKTHEAEGVFVHPDLNMDLKAVYVMEKLYRYFEVEHPAQICFAEWKRNNGGRLPTYKQLRAMNLPEPVLEGPFDVPASRKKQAAAAQPSQEAADLDSQAVQEVPASGDH